MVNTFPIMHLIPPPPTPQILHNLCFSLLLGITAVPRKIENNVYANFAGGGGRGQIRYIMGDVEVANGKDCKFTVLYRLLSK